MMHTCSIPYNFTTAISIHQSINPLSSISAQPWPSWPWPQVAFAFMANIKPPIALHAAWIVGFICSAFGGRPGMVNGATGAFAAIVGTFIPPAGGGWRGLGEL